jgi:hypothetical protein
VVNFNGTHYKVYYPEDGDEESLSEHDLDEVDIIDEDDQQHSSNDKEESALGSDDNDNEDDDTSSVDSVQPKFPIGTRFIKVCMNKCNKSPFFIEFKNLG